MNRSITRSRAVGALTVVVALLAAAPLLAVPPDPAAARPDAAQSGKSCHSSDGLAIHNCIEVLGGGLHVDRVRARTAMSYPTETKLYHFELAAGRWHHNTRDQIWEGTLIPGYVDSGWVKVNRNFRDGNGVCARLWIKRGRDWHNYHGMTCLRLSR
jgi:hypothetical protein